MRWDLTVSLLRYLGSAVATALVFVALYVVFVRTHGGQLVDQLAYDGADYGKGRIATAASVMLDAVPTIAGVAGLVLTVVIAASRRTWSSALIAVGAGGAAVLTTELLKSVFLDRPDLRVDGFADNSFPSGHTTVAAAAALAVFLVSSPAARPKVAWWGTVFTVLAGLSTLANRWHRPSDAIAALLVVAFWGCIAGAVITVIQRGGTTPPPREGPSAQWLIVVLLAGVTVVAFVVTYLGARSHESAVSLVAYVGGGAAIIAAGWTLALIGTRAFARLP